MEQIDAVLATLRAIQQPAFAADGQGRVVLINDGFATLLNPAAGVDADTAWRACLNDEGRTHWAHGIAAGQAFANPLALGKASGRWKYEASPVLGDGCSARWLAILKQETLADSLDEQLLRMSLHAAVRAGRMGLWEWSPQTGDSLWSPELYDVYRLPRGTGVEPGARFLAMVHPEDVPKIDAAVAAANTKGCIDPYVFRLHAGDGSLRWIMTCAQAARAAHEPGKPVSRLVGVNVDVTETVHAGELLEASRLERARHEQIMRAVMTHVPVGIAVALTGEAQLAYVSRFGAEMAQVSPECSRSWDAWQLCHPDTKRDARREELPLFRACDGALIRNEEWLLKAADGSLLPINCNAGPIHDEDGAIVGGTVAWHDVTSFKEAQRQRELLVAAVSHELRTPLSAIHGWSEVLQRSRDPSLMERGLLSIRRNVEMQVRLVDDLLDAARIAAGKLRLSLTQENLARVARAAVDSVVPIAESAQVVLDTVGDDVLPVLADEQRLRQAICNLLTNAVKFSRPGGLVAVTLAARNGMAELHVSDHGIGMDEEQLARAFDEFWQSRDSAGRKGGLGLGLSIAGHIVRGHGGTLDAHSEGVGKGATFTLRLPLRAAD
jgi:signal transduction histidine kinase